MIYSKKANFPYPLLTNDTTQYKQPLFDFDASLSDNNSYYIFNIKYEISSFFIRKLLQDGDATLYLIIKSKDNQFHEVPFGKKIIQIPKNRLYIGARTTLQLMIQSKKSINFKENNDLTSFYDDFKHEITVDRGMGLAFSNLVVFDGSQNKPFELFEKKVDKDIKSDIEIKLTDETIIIVYKSEDFIPQKKEFNYTYIYLGLQKALIAFLSRYTNSLEDNLELQNISMTETPLDDKLATLMTSKNITELSLSNIDEVIYLITDDIVKKYNYAISEVGRYEA